MPAAWGATPNPHELITTEVTPWSTDGLPLGSHHSWASMWVWGSTKPGVTMRPVASICCAASGSSPRPLTSTIRPSAMPMSRGRPGPPEPSKTSPLTMAQSNIVGPSRGRDV